MCRHLQITTTNEKPCCIDCGLVMEVYSNPYIRNITHYKQFYKQGIKINPFLLLGLEFKEQVIRFLRRQDSAIKKTEEKKERTLPCWFSIDSTEQKYVEYIIFLRQNQDRVLPKKKKRRKREIYEVYGDHKRMILEYIKALCSP